MSGGECHESSARRRGRIARGEKKKLDFSELKSFSLQRASLNFGQFSDRKRVF